MKRRERTRQLIELGGLIAKADLIDLTDDDRAVILGLLTEAAAKLRGADCERQMLLCVGAGGGNLKWATVKSEIGGRSLRPKSAGCGHQFDAA